MSRSSILGADRAPRQAEGRDSDALGPSDSSDSGSDVAGSTAIDAADEMDNIGQGMHAGRAGISDAGGTGERGSAVLGDDIDEGGDIMPDRIRRFSGSVGAEESTVDELADDEQTDDELADELADEDRPDEIPQDPIEPQRARPGGRSRRG